jgi:SAM-dependent methyltransferase
MMDVGFGAGGDEPYAEALDTDGMLVMRPDDRPHDRTEYDVSRWRAAADPVDLSLFEGVDGPVIDLGCGPGRMLAAAVRLGLPALGVDVSAAAVRIARRSGARVVHGSVFDPVPEEGRWDTAFLLDGNIGIGGDPTALLRRARDIVRVGGAVIVEANPNDHADRTFTATVTDDRGRVSASFPWAEVGRRAIVRAAQDVGLVHTACWNVQGRAFCGLRSAPRD